MTTPSFGGRPEQNVNPGADFQLAEGFGQLVNSIQGLQAVIGQQTSMLERTASAQARYSVAGLQMPQVTQAALQSIQAAGGMTPGMTGPASQMTGVGALSSLQNLQVYTSQRIGQWMAGVPLFQQGGGQQAPAAPATDVRGTPGMTPPGMPNSAAVPAGAGAQAYNQAAAAAAQATVAAIQAAAGIGPGVGGTGGPGGPGPGGPGGPAPGGPPPGGLPGGGTTVQRYMQLAGARIAMSGGSPGGLISAVRGLPVIGTALDILQHGTSFFQGQWAAGRQFQEAEGGTNLGGQAERFHQAIYQASMALTPMGAGAAGQAFNDVTAMGYNRAAPVEEQQGAATGQNRMGALNFIYSNFTGSGMSVDQSAQILQTASQNSAISLQNLTQVLKTLSDTAGKAGTNADQARQSFEQTFQAAIHAGAGPGAPQLAGAVAATQASYGKQFAGTSFAGELSMTRSYMLSGQYGILPAQLQYLQRNNPQQAANMIAGQNLGFIQNELGLSQTDLAQLQKIIQEHGGNNSMSSPDAVDQVAQQWLNWGDANDPGAFNVDIWAQVLSSLTNIPLTPANVAQWIVKQVAGQNEASQAAKMPAPGGTGTRSGSATVPASRAGSAVSGQYGLAKAVEGSMNGVSSRLIGPTGAKTWQQVLTGKSGSAAQAYLSEEKKSGQRSPVLEALLQNLGAGTQVQVQTKTGPRVMNLTDAVKYYPDELMAGNAMFFSASGKTMLGTTSQITHGLTDPNEPVSGEEHQVAGSNLGVSLKSWRRQHGSTYLNAGTGKSVTINLSSEAKQLLKLLPTNSDQAAASGTVPAVPWPSVSSR